MLPGITAPFLGPDPVQDPSGSLQDHALKTRHGTLGFVHSKCTMLAAAVACKLLHISEMVVKAQGVTRFTDVSSHLIRKSQ